MENKKVHQPHDKGYKSLLSKKEAFMDLLRGFIKEDWVDQIEEDSLVKVDSTYILKDYTGREADIVYRGNFKGQEVIFYVLLELQSTVDHQIPFRLLIYMTEIWREYVGNLKDEKKE